jgi:uncharacterized membrane protein
METKDLGKTTIGMEANLAGALAYLLGLITGIIFFAIEKENKFVRFHAMQSILFCVAWIILGVALSVLMMIPVLGWIISILGYLIIGLGGFILWLFIMYKAYQGEQYLLPVVGEIALRQVQKA